MNKSLLKVAHETVKGLHDIGLVNKVSQPVFAYILNVSPSTIKHWEIRDKHPNGAALKLLDIIARKGINAVF